MSTHTHRFLFQQYLKFVRQYPYSGFMSREELPEESMPPRLKFLQMVEGDGGDPITGIHEEEAGQFRLEVLWSVDDFKKKDPKQEVPYDVHEGLGRLIDNYIARGVNIPE